MLILVETSCQVSKRVAGLKTSITQPGLKVLQKCIEEDRVLFFTDLVQIPGKHCPTFICSAFSSKTNLAATSEFFGHRFWLGFNLPTSLLAVSSKALQNLAWAFSMGFLWRLSAGLYLTLSPLTLKSLSAQCYCQCFQGLNHPPCARSRCKTTMGFFDQVPWFSC